MSERHRRTEPAEFTIEITEPAIPMHKSNPHVSHAAIKLNGVTIFEEDVYDNTDTNPAEDNIVQMFARALGKLIDPERYL